MTPKLTPRKYRAPLFCLIAHECQKFLRPAALLSALLFLTLSGCKNEAKSGFTQLANTQQNSGTPAITESSSTSSDSSPPAAVDTGVSNSTATPSPSPSPSASLSPSAGGGVAPSSLSYSGSSVVLTKGVTITALTTTLGVGAGVTFSVSPSLPAGISFDPATGMITGAPTVLKTATAYTVTATNSFGSTQATVTVTVIDAPPTALNYTAAGPYTFIKGTAITQLTPSNTGGSVVSYSLSSALPTGLSLNASTGVISGTPTAITAQTTFTVTATNTGGTTSKALTITVNDAAPTNLAYLSQNPTYVKNVAITDNVPTHGGGDPTIYAIDAALPTGLTFNTSTGAIYGTPTAVVSATIFTISATNTTGYTTAVVTIEVANGLAAPSTLSYLVNSQTYTKGSAITNNSPTYGGGTPTSFSVTPALPTGLSLDTTSGVISGTPSAITSSASYTVTATNGAGSSNKVITIVVNDSAPSALTYTSNSVSYTKDVAISTNSPSSSGGAVVSYSVSPALPTGLSLNTSTGAITGTPTVVTSSASYTVTATNTGGSTTRGITITVAGVPTKLSYSGSTGPMVNDCTAYTLNAQDGSSVDTVVTQSTVVNIHDGTGAGIFYSDSGCSSVITSVTYAVGEYTKTVYYKDASAQSVTLEANRASGNSLTDATKAVTVASPTSTCCTSSAVTDVSGNQVWLKADALTSTDGTKITSWTDSSSNANHAIQANSSWAPTYKTNIINGKPVLRFTATSYNWLTLKNNINPTPASHTVFAVMSVANYKTNTYLFGGIAGSYNGSSWGILKLNATAGCEGAPVYGFGDGSSYQLPTSYCNAMGKDHMLFPGNNQFIVLTYKYTTGSVSPAIYSNGVRIGVPAANSTITSVTSTAMNFSLGRTGAYDGEYTNEDIAEFLIYDTALSDTNQAKIEGYLMTKYGFTPRLRIPAPSSSTVPSSSLAPATSSTTTLDTYGGSGTFSYSVAAGSGSINSNAQFVAPSSAGFSVVKSTDTDGNSDYALFQTGSSADNLKLWLKPEAIQQATGSSVCRWNDSSAAGNSTWAASNLSTRICGGTGAPTYQTGAINSKAVVRFDEAGGANGASGQKLSAGTQIATPTAGFTIVGVATTTTASTSWLAVLWGAATSFPGNQWGLLQFDGTGSGYMRYNFNDNTGSTTSRSLGITQSAVFSSTNTPYLVTQRHTSGDRFDEIFLNGTAKSTTASVSYYTDPVVNSTAQFAVGGLGNFGSRFWEGDIPEIMVFNRNLTTAELSVIYSYFGAKYGITVP